MSEERWELGGRIQRKGGSGKTVTGLKPGHDQGTSPWSRGDVHGNSLTGKQGERERRVRGQATQDLWGDVRGRHVHDGGHVTLCVYQTS